MEINDYIVLSNEYESSLERDVIHYLGLGYELAGGLVVVVLQNSTHSSKIVKYKQAVYRRLIPNDEV